MHYEGSVLKIPISYKWENDFVATNLKIFFSTGLAIGFTINEKFIVKNGITPTKNKTTLNLNGALGFLYKFNSEIAAFTSLEFYSGDPKSKEKVGFIFSSRIRTEESFLNIGLRFKLK